MDFIYLEETTAILVFLLACKMEDTKVMKKWVCQSIYKWVIGRLVGIFKRNITKSRNKKVPFHLHRGSVDAEILVGY